jgi:hypothetical protein
MIHDWLGSIPVPSSLKCVLRTKVADERNRRNWLEFQDTGIGRITAYFVQLGILLQYWTVFECVGEIAGCATLWTPVSAQYGTHNAIQRVLERVRRVYELGFVVVATKVAHHALARFVSNDARLLNQPAEIEFVTAFGLFTCCR